VLAHVEQHVSQSIPDFARSTKRSDVIAPEQDPPSKAEHAMRCASYARGDRLHPASQRVLARRLDDQVQMVALDRELGDAELAAFAPRGEAASHVTCAGQLRGCGSRAT
jgi:hypothetical protein